MATISNSMNPLSAPVRASTLLDAIRNFENGMDEFNAAGDEEMAAYGGEEAMYEATVESSWTLLADWPTPATTLVEAAAAARLAEKCDGDAVAVAMAAAALAYLTRTSTPDASPPAAPVTPKQISALPALESMDPQMLLTTGEAAEYLRASLPTLARWRGSKLGPLYVKRSGHVLYTVGALRDYIDASERQGTRPDR